MAYEMSKMKGKRPEPSMTKQDGEGSVKKMAAAKKMASTMKPAAKKKMMKKKM
jgi:hypothetical protein